MPISSTFLLIAIIVNALLGVVVYLQSERSRSTTSFFMIVASVFFWAAPLYIYGFLDDADLSLAMSKVSYFAAAWSALALVNFAIHFDYKPLASRKQKILTTANFFFPLVFAYLLSGPLLLKGFRTFEETEKIIEFGPLYPLYSVFIIGAFLLGFIVIYRKYLSEADIIRRKQFQYVFAGILVTVVGGIVTNLILPSLGDFNFYWLGPIFTLIMVAFFTISILKHKLFNSKIITTELFVFALWIVILGALLLTTDISSRIFYGVLLVLTFTVGLFLIRSVIREVEQREKIEVLAKDLEETNGRQEKLIHFIGHEVKGYLTKGEYAFSEMAEGDFGVLPPETKILATTALNELRKGVASVTDILKAANLKRGTVTYELKPVDFKELIKEEVIKTKPQAEEKKLAFEVSMDEGEEYKVNLDRTQFGEHVLRNLIDNAIKYTPKGSITIRLARAGDKIVFSVKDSGVGITAEDKTRLFTEGGHGKDSMKVNVHSTGYGLYIAKGIVEAHKGRIWAESEGENKGSVFFVELPIVSQ